MGITEIIIIAGVAIGLIERIIKIFKDKAKKAETKEKLDTAAKVAETLRGSLEEVQGSSSVIIKAIEGFKETKPAVFKEVTETVTLTAIAEGLKEQVDAHVQSVVQNK